MKRAAAACVVAVLGLVAVTGCGGGTQSSAADEQAIRDLVSQVNRATARGDAGAACDVIAPSSITARFNTRARCVRETGAILRSAGKQPRIEVQSIEVNGDRATVTFKGRNGEVEVIREDGRWYIPIATDQQGSGTTGAGQ